MPYILHNMCIDAREDPVALQADPSESDVRFGGLAADFARLTANTMPGNKEFTAAIDAALSRGPDEAAQQTQYGMLKHRALRALQPSPLEIMG